MPKWENTISSGDIPVYMYKLTKSYVDKIGEEVCKKGVNVRGVIMYKDWYSFRQEQTKLSDLVHGNSSNSQLDYRIYSMAKNEILYERVENKSENSEIILNLEEEIQNKIKNSVLKEETSESEEAVESEPSKKQNKKKK